MKPGPSSASVLKARPNPNVLSIGKIVTVDGLTVTGLEAPDGSPVIEINPHVRDSDCIREPGSLPQRAAALLNLHGGWKALLRETALDRYPRR
jgi:tRNA (Thr-GGU) A37 N-methylase